jgi:hypothetical protein
LSEFTPVRTASNQSYAIKVGDHRLGWRWTWRPMSTI